MPPTDTQMLGRSYYKDPIATAFLRLTSQGSAITSIICACIQTKTSLSHNPATAHNYHNHNIISDSQYLHVVGIPHRPLMSTLLSICGVATTTDVCTSGVVSSTSSCIVPAGNKAMLSFRDLSQARVKAFSRDIQEEECEEGKTLMYVVKDS